MAQSPLPSWGVVCTAAEPAALAVSFAAHHLAMGARHVWMFLDHPQPETAALLRALPGCVVETCDDAYWDRQPGRRPKLITRRQLRNADLVYSGTDLDWILHLDCDEFLRCDYPLAEILAGLPDTADYGIIRPAERFGLTDQPQEAIFDGVFRRPEPRTEDNTRDGEMAHRGLTGHAFGKSVARVGRPMLLGIHSPRPMANPEGWRPTRIEVPGVTVLHFDGITPAHWQAKLMRAAVDHQNRRFLEGRNPWRLAQVEHVEAAADPGAACSELYDRLKVLNAEQLAALVAGGFLDTRAFDPTPALNRYGMAEEVDLSVAAFDAAFDGARQRRSPAA